MSAPMIRPAVTQLVEAVTAAVELGPCWVLRAPGQVALIGPDGSGGHRFVAGFRRPTLSDALGLGLLVLGEGLVPVPQYTGGGSTWAWDGGHHQGRTIALGGGAR